MKQVAPGITILKRYGRHKNACWILQAGNEAAVVEMPPFSGGERAPYRRTESFTRRRKLHLKYALLSHGHIDHCASLPEFRRWFPQTRFITHESLLHDRHFHYLLARNRYFPYQSWVEGHYRLFDEVFSEPVWTGSLGGEPLHLIHAPKHSGTDLMIVFRGAMITGDWVVGDLRDCNALVSTPQKLHSIDRVQRVIGGLGYHVHMLFSAHGDHLMYRADFQRLMERSKHVHR